MVKQSRGRRALVQLLQGTNQPVYLLDEESKLVFVNEALCEWTGRRDDELLGLRCSYHASPPADESTSTQLGLAPPPSLFDHGGKSTVWCLHRGEVKCRHATFQRLANNSANASALLLAFLSEDLVEDEIETPGTLVSPTSRDWHGRLIDQTRELGPRLMCEALVGESAAIKRIRNLVKLCGEVEANAVISGPAGSRTGDVAERVLAHRCAPNQGRFLKLDAAAMNDELLRASVLTFWQRGRESTTHDGILLANVDRFDAQCQATLFQLLFEERLGLCVISTSAKPLRSIAGFHNSLANALSEIEVELVPLPERLDDLPMIAQAVIERLNSESSKQLDGLSLAALERLVCHHWRRDLDELIECLTKAYQNAKTHSIQPEDLPDRIDLSADAELNQIRPAEPIQLDDYLQQIECELVKRALDQTNGNRAASARLLGITRSRLLRRIQSLGIGGEGKTPTEDHVSEVDEPHIDVDAVEPVQFEVDDDPPPGFGGEE